MASLRVPRRPLHCSHRAALPQPLPDAIEDRIRTLPDLFTAGSQVLLAYLFGSGARGELRPTSDIDVAVFLADDADPLLARADLVAEISRHLGTDRRDLVVLNEAPTALLGRTLRDRRVLFDREPFRRHRFKSLALRQFHDFALFEHRLLERRRRG